MCTERSRWKEGNGNFEMGGGRNLNIWSFIFYLVTNRAEKKKNFKDFKVFGGIRNFFKNKNSIKCNIFSQVIKYSAPRIFFFSPQNYKFVFQINFSARAISFVILQQFHHVAYSATGLSWKLEIADTGKTNQMPDCNYLIFCKVIDNQHKKINLFLPLLAFLEDH